LLLVNVAKAATHLIVSMSDGNGSDDEEGVHRGVFLSAETMAALKDFAILSGIPVLGNARKVKLMTVRFSQLIDSPPTLSLITVSENQ
jgi:hypothetical protein